MLAQTLARMLAGARRQFALVSTYSVLLYCNHPQEGVCWELGSGDTLAFGQAAVGTGNVTGRGQGHASAAVDSTSLEAVGDGLLLVDCRSRALGGRGARHAA